MTTERRPADDLFERILAQYPNLFGAPSARTPPAPPSPSPETDGNGALPSARGGPLAFGGRLALRGLEGVGRRLRPLTAPYHFLVAEAQAQRELGKSPLPLGIGARFQAGVAERQAQILGVSEKASLRKKLQAAIGYGETRPSIFPGEKLIGEALVDPAALFFALPPLGVAKALGRGSKAAVKGAPLFERIQNVLTALPDPNQPVKIFADFPSERVLKVEGYEPNKLRRLTTQFFKSPLGKVPFLRTPVHLANPSALIDATNEGDTLARALVDYERLLEYADNVVTHDVSSLRSIERHALKELTYRDGNVFLRVAEKGQEELKEVPLQDVMERFGRYELTEPQLQLVKTADIIIDRYFGRAARERVRIPQLLGFAEGEHYFPRFVRAIGELENLRLPTGGRAVGIKPSIVRTRLHDLADEAVKNGVQYLGGRSRTPVSDIVETYAKAVTKTVADHRLIAEIKPLGTTLNERVGEAALKRVGKATRQYRKSKAVVTVVENALKWQQRPPASELGRVTRFNSELGDLLKEAFKRSATPFDFAMAITRAKRISEDLRKMAFAELVEARMRKKAISDAVRAPIGMRAVPDQAGLSGLLFSDEDAELIRKALSPSDIGVLRGAAAVTSLMRAGSLTIDHGFAMLQGAMVLTNAPVTWIKAASAALLSTVDPEVRWRYLASPEVDEVFRVFKGRISIGSNEFTEALGRGGLLTRLAPVGTRRGFVVGNTFGRYATSFEMFFDLARIEMGKAYLPAIRRGSITVEQAASIVNKMTGVVSSRALGVSATQREVESVFLFLAPRWFRATVGLGMDAIQGGARGHEARMAWSKFFGGTVLAYVGAALYMGQEPKLDPRPRSKGGDGSQFMTVEVNGHHIGLGGKPYSMVRTMVKMATDVPGAHVYAAQFLRSGAAPLTSSMWDIWEGRTYIGEPIKDAGDIVRHEVLGRFLPFYASAQLNNRPRPGATGLTAEYLGLRAWPKPPSEHVEDIQDQLAALLPTGKLAPDQFREMERRGLEAPEWDILSSLQKRLIIKGETGIKGIDTRKEELKRWTEVAKGQEQVRGDRALNAFFADLENARVEWEEEAKTLARGVPSVRSPAEFLERMKLVNAAYSSQLKQVYDPEGAHQEAMAKLQEARARKEYLPVADLAKEQYIERLVAATDLVDSMGEYDFAEADRRREGLVRDFGPRAVREAEASFLAGKDAPKLWKKWVQDRDTLRPYWELRDSYFQRNPGVKPMWDALRYAENSRDLATAAKLIRHPSLRRMERALDDQKLALRKALPLLDATLVFWGKAQKTRSQEATDIIIGWLRGGF